MDVLLKFLNLPRDVAIGILTPIVNILESLLEFSFSVLLGSGPGLPNNAMALRILQPNMLKPLDFIEAVRVVPVVKIRTKNKQDGIVIRCMAGQVIVSDSSVVREPGGAGTESIQPLLNVMSGILIIVPSIAISMVPKIQ
jgi:hypothetical protein